MGIAQVAHVEPSGQAADSVCCSLSSESWGGGGAWPGWICTCLKSLAPKLGPNLESHDFEGRAWHKDTHLLGFVDGETLTCAIQLQHHHAMC